MSIYRPYTYLLYHIPTKKYYYGAKYGKDADPSTFWKNYFTSSTHVKYLINEYGKDSFEFWIHKTFNTAEKCLKSEVYFLNSVNAVQNNRFLNKHIFGNIYQGYSKNSSIKMLENRSFNYLVITPNNEELQIINLTKFCKENILDCSEMVKVSKGKARQHKGI